MWEDASPHMVNYLRGNAVSYNNHKKAVTPKVKINLINDRQLYQSNFNRFFFFFVSKTACLTSFRKDEVKRDLEQPFHSTCTITTNFSL